MADTPAAPAAAPTPLGPAIPNGDGTYTVWYSDGSTRTYGTKQDPVALARQKAAEVKAYYDDPWIREHVLGPMNRASEAQSQDRVAASERAAQQLRNEAARLLIEGRTAEAQEKNQQAMVELKKAELLQSGQFKAAELFMEGAKPAYASQFVDIQRRAPGFMPQTGSFSAILEGRRPQNAFGIGVNQGATTVNDVLFGAGGGPSQAQLVQRNEADKAVAGRLAAGVGGLVRGSLEALDPYEKDYLDSLWKATGRDPGVVDRAYKAAGIHQGPR